MTLTKSQSSERSRSYGTLSSNLVEAAMAEDAVQEPLPSIQSLSQKDDDGDSDSDSDRSQSTSRSYQPRPLNGYIIAGSRHGLSPLATSSRPTLSSKLHARGSEQSIPEERGEWKGKTCSLLGKPNQEYGKAPDHDNGSFSSISRLCQHLDLVDSIRDADEEERTLTTAENREETLTESSNLVGGIEQSFNASVSPKNTSSKWETAVAAGRIHTTWKREAKVLGKYSRSLIATFILQYSLTVASIFTVGHLGKVELGAVSIASMTANIAGYAIYQGLATSLDTLCPQAYGSRRKHLVGLQMQRMIYFLLFLTLPIGIIWLNATNILSWIVPEPRIAALAGQYLKILLIGIPGYICFESGKRFVQAQGLFSATFYVLLFCAPLNVLMNWLFVWVFNWGFVGAPIAVVVTDNLLPICLFLYVRFVNGKDCWGGFSKSAFQHWSPMIRLALPGLLMLEAEFLAFEILTLAASYFSTTHLAAQSILATVSALTFQIPFPISIAASTRIANLIGATLPGAAKLSAMVALFGACVVGIFNMILLSTLRHIIPRLFTSDRDVAALVAKVLPLCAAFQLFDALAANCNGVLRGLGRQEIGGWVSLFCYYVIAIPLSIGTGFGLGLDLYGLWIGPAVALGLVAAIEGWFIRRIDWERSVADAQRRNMLS